MLILTLCGCGRRFDGNACLDALLSAVFSADYSAYADYTGNTTADLAAQRDEWLDSEADAFIAAFGNLTPSSSEKEKIRKLLDVIYSNARYETGATGQTEGMTISDIYTETDNAADSEEYTDTHETAELTIYPINIFKAYALDIQNYTSQFNQNNDAFQYFDDTAQQYADEYYDGLVTLIQANLGEITYDEPRTVTVRFFKDKGTGLYLVSPEQLGEIARVVLPYT